MQEYHTGFSQASDLPPSLWLHLDPTRFANVMEWSNILQENAVGSLLNMTRSHHGRNVPICLTESHDWEIPGPLVFGQRGHENFPPDRKFNKNFHLASIGYILLKLFASKNLHYSYHLTAETINKREYMFIFILITDIYNRWLKLRANDEILKKLIYLGSIPKHSCWALLTF